MILNTSVIGPWLKKTTAALKKYQYVLLVLAIGIGLMLFPQKEPEPEAVPAIAETGENDLQNQLESLLRQVEGAGEVRVLLSWECGTSYSYQTDTEQKITPEGTEERRTTVFASSDGTEEAVAVQTIYPICRGAVVVCQGADRSSVKLAVVRAVSSITGLGSDRITVIKMKSGK